jgi:hypothetical protein
MANIDEIAKAFVNHYYGIFDTNRANLAGLYVRSRLHFLLERRDTNILIELKHVICLFVFLNNVQQDQSMLTFEGQKFQGPKSIMEKIIVINPLFIFEKEI